MTTCQIVTTSSTFLLPPPRTTPTLTSSIYRGSTVPNQPAGVFWAVVNRLLIIFQIIVLILSEIGWPATFFAKYFPVLGPDFGLGALGIFQCLIGATILSHHVDDFTLVAAFFLFSLGCLNMFLGLFRERVKHKRSIMSWREEAKGILPTHKDLRPPFARPASAFIGRVFNRGEKTEATPALESKGMGFGRQGEKAAGMKGTSTAPCKHTIGTKALTKDRLQAS